MYCFCVLVNVTTKKNKSGVTVLLFYSWFANEILSLEFDVKILKQTCGRQFVTLLIFFFSSQFSFFFLCFLICTTHRLMSILWFCIRVRNQFVDREFQLRLYPEKKKKLLNALKKVYFKKTSQGSTSLV